MNRRGNRLELYNKAHYGYETHSKLMNFTMPVVVSSDQYILHFDNAPIGFLDLDSKQNNKLVYETISGRKTYQVISAENWPELINQYTKLTGKQPMPHVGPQVILQVDLDTILKKKLSKLLKNLMI